MSGYEICECRCAEHKAAEIGRQSERWRLDVEEAIRAREHALKPREIAAIDQTVSLLKIDT